MTGVWNFIVGVIVLLLGVPTGNFLAKVTKEELKSGQRWFRIICFLSIIFAIASLILGNDPLLFGFLFMLIVTSRSLKK